jgi:hypothetical protein
VVKKSSRGGVGQGGIGRDELAWRTEGGRKVRREWLSKREKERADVKREGTIYEEGKKEWREEEKRARVWISGG